VGGSVAILADMFVVARMGLLAVGMVYLVAWALGLLG
jgi:hypothetical protein